jgi:hypothetical protein
MTQRTTTVGFDLNRLPAVNGKLRLGGSALLINLVLSLVLITCGGAG